MFLASLQLETGLLTVQAGDNRVNFPMSSSTKIDKWWRIEKLKLVGVQTRAQKQKQEKQMGQFLDEASTFLGQTNLVSETKQAEGAEIKW